MPDCKQQENLPSPSENRVGTNAGAVSSVIRDDGSLGEILRVLEKNEAISAWLQTSGREQPELFVLLADKLSRSEKEALTDIAHVVIQPDDNPAKRIADLEKENELLRSLSLTDGLTGLYNYRYFAKQLEVELARTQRTGQPCSLIMVDLDDFKSLNDTLGHDAGNRFLVHVSHEMLNKLRPTDIMCRYGGDEFAVIMPATALFDAIRIARRLKRAVCGIPASLAQPFSASIGIAEYDPSSGPQEIGTFVNMADSALYRAKKGGKNKICYKGKLPQPGRADAVTGDEKAALLDGGAKK
jgi:two-component system cell cycle response regulator